MSNTLETATRIKQDGLIAILRGDFPLDHILAIADTLQGAGISILEVTLNSAGALQAVAALRQACDGLMLIGAGTVRTAAQAEAALDAGAEFLVAPNFDAHAVARAQARDILFLPGVFTPTEAETAFRAGCTMVKLFPADVVGPAYIKALRAPLNDIEFVPTGGVNVETIPGFVKAGAVAVGIGGALITNAQQPLSEIAQRALALRRAWEQAHA